MSNLNKMKKLANSHLSSNKEMSLGSSLYFILTFLPLFNEEDLNSFLKKEIIITPFKFYRKNTFIEFKDTTNGYTVNSIQIKNVLFDEKLLKLLDELNNYFSEITFDGQDYNDGINNFKVGFKGLVYIKKPYFIFDLGQYSF